MRAEYGSALDALCDRGCNLLITVRRLEERCIHIRADAFLAEIMGPAEITEEQVLEGEKKLATNPGLLEVSATINRLVAAISECYITAPPSAERIVQLVSASGNKTAETEMGQLALTPTMVFIIAVRLAEQRMPEVFGEYDSTADHQRALTETREQLNDVMKDMREQYMPSELRPAEPPPEPRLEDARRNVTERMASRFGVGIVDISGVQAGTASLQEAIQQEYDRLRQHWLMETSPARRAAGKGWRGGMVFKRAPQVYVDDPHWPRLLLEDEARKCGVGSGPAVDEVKPAKTPTKINDRERGTKRRISRRIARRAAKVAEVRA